MAGQSNSAEACSSSASPRGPRRYEFTVGPQLGRELCALTFCFGARQHAATMPSAMPPACSPGVLERGPPLAASGRSLRPGLLDVRWIEPLCEMEA